MATTADVRGILIAGETPEVKGVQVHQDKLGEYIRLGEDMNGRPAHYKARPPHPMRAMACLLCVAVAERRLICLAG
jgi:hypothetical protein|tara:strand:+ start:219 stop:446 length:228 start_codon:yes stop_codon:yes gene_type:complete